ncbi:MAG: hypothetical protein E7249_01915 [Paenibacillaceae bacterium]|nr:hypothetical protein [Paenibacillaceae bacterium]
MRQSVPSLFSADFPEFYQITAPCPLPTQHLQILRLLSNHWQSDTLPLFQYKKPCRKKLFACCVIRNKCRLILKETHSAASIGSRTCENQPVFCLFLLRLLFLYLLFLFLLFFLFWF